MSHLVSIGAFIFTHVEPVSFFVLHCYMGLPSDGLIRTESLSQQKLRCPSLCNLYMLTKSMFDRVGYDNALTENDGEQLIV